MSWLSEVSNWVQHSNRVCSRDTRDLSNCLVWFGNLFFPFLNLLFCQEVSLLFPTDCVCGTFEIWCVSFTWTRKVRRYVIKESSDTSKLWGRSPLWRLHKIIENSQRKHHINRKQIQCSLFFWYMYKFQTKYS